MAKSSFFKIDINFSDADMKELFEPFDPLRVSDKEFSNDVTPRGKFDPIDFPYIESVKDSFLGDLLDHYFRARIHDLDKVRDEGPAILGCNHSGTAFPHDALMLDALLWRHSEFRKDRKCRSVYSPKLAKSWWMRPFGIDDFWRRGGAVDMTFDNFDQLLEQEERVIYYPEGVPGIGKGFSRRYQLQHFYSSFVVLSARHNAPFYPIICVNAEWVNPTSITIGWVDKVFDKLLGVPFFPIPAAIIALVFPFFFYLAFPGNMKFFVLDPVDIRAWLEEEGCTNFQKPDRTATQRVANRVKEYMQKELDDAVLNHGQKPYHWTSLKRRMKQIKKRDGNWIGATPFGWPFTFLKHERNMNRPPAKNKFHDKLRDWDIWLYFVPFGWFILGLTRKFRKPPYGYRGLSKREKKLKTGGYFWSLNKNPMPRREERF
jgi:1-acyl-sn-glycerol-3-phosphate acyltransferase